MTQLPPVEPSMLQEVLEHIKALGSEVTRHHHVVERHLGSQQGDSRVLTTTTLTIATGSVVQLVGLDLSRKSIAINTNVDGIWIGAAETLRAATIDAPQGFLLPSASSTVVTTTGELFAFNASQDTAMVSALIEKTAN